MTYTQIQYGWWVAVAFALGVLSLILDWLM